MYAKFFSSVRLCYVWFIFILWFLVIRHTWVHFRGKGAKIGPELNPIAVLNALALSSAEEIYGYGNRGRNFSGELKLYTEGYIRYGLKPKLGHDEKFQNPKHQPRKSNSIPRKYTNRVA